MILLIHYTFDTFVLHDTFDTFVLHDTFDTFVLHDTFDTFVLHDTFDTFVLHDTFASGRNWLCRNHAILLFQLLHTFPAFDLMPFFYETQTFKLFLA
jgi:hypothetical protein